MKAYDAIIVGGGIIGGSIALALARENLKVLVLDRAEAGLEASWAAAGMLSPGPENFATAEEPETTHFVPFAKASFDLYPAFVEEIEGTSHLATGFQRNGTIELFFSPRAKWERDQTIRAHHQFGLTAEPITLSDAVAKAPNINRESSATAWLPDECTVDPRLLTRAVLTAAKTRGADFRTNCAVEKIRTADRGNVVVIAASETIHAANVIIAAGCFSSQIGGLANFAPTTPVRGQMIALQFGEDSNAPVLRSQSGYIVPRGDGRVVAGSTLENAGYRKQVTQEGKEKILNAARQLAPRIATAPVLETWSGLRPDTPDHLPIVGSIGVKGLWVATGHYRNGILLAPATARAISGLILHGKSPIDISHFSPLRFTHSTRSTQAVVHATPDR